MCYIKKVFLFLSLADVWKAEVSPGVFYHSPPYFLRQGLAPNLELYLLDWLTSKSQNPPVLFWWQGLDGEPLEGQSNTPLLPVLGLSTASGQFFKCLLSDLARAGDLVSWSPVFATKIIVLEMIALMF